MLVATTAITASAACSPYVYKTEINGFSAGVDQLAAAYNAGLRSVAEDRADRQRWLWTDGQAKLAITDGCAPGVAGAPEATTPCGLREVGQPIPEPSKVEQQAANAAPIVKAFQDYAAALAAVTDAADREALDAAQADLKRSVEAFTKQANPALAAGAGPLADLFAAVTGAALDTRRYQVLKAGVTTAKQPVAVLGGVMGDALDALRAARADELQPTAVRLGEGLGPKLGGEAYAVRLDALQGKVAALEALRRATPKQAATDMVAAHDALAQALADNSRQVDTVVSTVKTFVDKAKAVHEAFVTGAAA
jgi:hypothetical protein